MPARRAIASVDAPCRPLTANSARAASRTSSRRSSAVWRLAVVALITSRKLSLTHYPCQDLRNPVEVALGEPRPGLEQLLEPAQLRDPDRAEDVGEPVVRARRPDLEVASRLDPVVPVAADRVGELLARGRDGASLPGRDDLARMERQAGEL